MRAKLQLVATVWMAGSLLLLPACKDAQPGKPGSGGASDGGGGQAGSGGLGGSGGAIVPGPSGSLDESFGEAGVALVDFGGDETARAVATDATDRVVIAGVSNASVTTFAVARLTDVGLADRSFGTFGLVATSFDNDYDGVEGLGILPDGRLVAAGTTFSTDVLNGVSGYALARYVDNGTLDTTFGDDGKVVTDFAPTAAGFALASDGVMQPDGKMVVLGGSAEIVLARYTPAGALDTSFSGNGWTQSSLSADEQATQPFDVSLDAAGRSLVAGRHLSTDSASTGLLARFTNLGASDSAFGSGGFVTVDLGPGGIFYRATEVEGGAIVAAGLADGHWVVCRFSESGALDTRFGDQGFVRMGPDAFPPAGVVPVGADVIIVGSYAGPEQCPCSGTNCDKRCGRLAAVRLDPTGALVPSFGLDGQLEAQLGSDDRISDVTVDSYGRLVVVGSTAGQMGEDFVVTRIWP